MRGKASFEQIWQEVVEHNFPKTNKDQHAINMGDIKRYGEEKVDSMRKQKDEELEHYKKEIERAKRFENAKASGTGDKIVVKKKVVAATNGTVPQGAGQRTRINRP